MLDATSRDAQELVALVPPYDGEATVEKVAINAVMAGCPPACSRSCWPRSRRRASRPSRCSGCVSTTHPSGPVVVVSGPLGRAGRDERRRQRARPGQPREPDDRSRAPAGGPQRRRRPAAGGGSRGARAARQAQLVLRRAPARLAVAGVGAGPWRPRGRDGRDAVRRRGAAADPRPAGAHPGGAVREPRRRARVDRAPAPAARVRRAARGRARARPRIPRGRLGPRARAEELQARSASPSRRAGARRRRDRRGDRGAVRQRPGGARSPSSPRPSGSCSLTPAATRACSAWSTAAGYRGR